MSERILVSIVVNNYNYERFLRKAIDSALDQTFQNIEVIVVDDGSTDHSKEIIHEYKDRITPVFKENGGQGSAFNEGFKASHGDIIMFLDADDCLLPEAAEVIATQLDPHAHSKLHWPLWIIDGENKKTGQITPVKKLQEKGLLENVVALGPNGYLSPPTSGNAWSRKFLSSVFPMPAQAFRISADNFICMLAPLYGQIKALDKPLSLYRLHGNNNFRGKDLDEHLLQTKVKRFEESCEILAQHMTKLGIPFDQEQWYAHSWLKKLEESLAEIKALVPVHDKFILVDDNQWQMNDTIADRIIIPFKEKENKYWGPPSDDQDAIAEIERQKSQGARYIFFAWPAFWFMEHFKTLMDYLEKNASVNIRNERIVGYELNSNSGR